MSEPTEGEIVNRGIQPTKSQVERTLAILDQGDEERKITIIETTAAKVLEKYRIVRFRGRTFILTADPFEHYRLLGLDEFKRMAYIEAGGVPRSRIGDVWDLVQSACDDLTPNGHKILFGMSLADATMHPELADYNVYLNHNNKQRIWDTKTLQWLPTSIDEPDNIIWRSPYPCVEKVGEENPEPVSDEPLEFIMSLAGGDRALYDDIMQSIAPLMMDKKPDGVIWWVGAGANGKSTLMDALYKIFPGQLASMNVKRLVDGRDTPGLNGKLANIAKESSEGRIDDTEIYKCLGTHENFDTHKFHSQESITVNGNIHSIFSGNSIPVFADKGHSIRRRTFIIPFNQVFESDPDFERKTFTAEFFGRLVREMAKYAKRLESQGYRYRWSAATTGAKETYDREASNAEEYARTLVNDDGVVAFYTYGPVQVDYENWCRDEGFAPLGLNNLRKAMVSVGFERYSKRTSSGFSNIYRLRTVEASESLRQIGGGRPGLWVRDGAVNLPDDEEDEKPKQQTILNGKW